MDGKVIGETFILVFRCDTSVSDSVEKYRRVIKIEK